MNPLDGRVAAALAAAVWGTTYAVTTAFLPPHPIFIGAVRALGAGLPLLLLIRSMPPTGWWWRLSILGGLNCGLLFAFLFVAALRLPGGLAATLQSLSPLLTVLLSWPLLGQRPAAMQVACVVAGAVGVALLLLGDSTTFDMIGAISAVLGALCLSLGGVLVERWGRPMPILAFTAWQLSIAGVGLLIAAFIAGDMPERITSVNVAAFAYLAIPGTALAYAAWFVGIERAGAATVAPALLLIPVVAFVLDAVVSRLAPTALQLIGAILVLGSVAASQRAPRPRR